ncbi:MAG TPA: glycosyltransferase [Pilimelia sp.]|nr:glycosyltransferase [Pilimelia sp.]
MSGQPSAGRRLRVALVLKTSEGGAWTVPHVDRLRARGHEVVALLPAGPGRLRTALAERGVPVLDSAFDFRFRPAPAAVRGLVGLRRQLRGLRPDVVHYHLYASALAGRLCGLGLRARRVHMVAGPLYLDSPVIRSVERLLVRLDHLTIAGSEHTAARYRALGVPAARTPVIPYGVDTGRFTPPSAAERARARAALGIADDILLAVMVAYVYAPKRAVYAGRGIKGHDVLLAAWRAFHAAAPKSHLLVVGAGFDAAGEAYRQELLARYGVGGEPSVTWLSSVADVREYYRAADVSVSPSLSENHGAALEAGAMGLPSIVSDAGGLPETVDPAAGWLVPRGDAAPLAAALGMAYREFEVGVLADRGRRARRRTVVLFDRDHAAERVADAVERCAGTGTGVRS